MVKGMKPIFQEHECLSEGAIQGYLGNRLSLNERHKVENHLLDCPLCSDAVEGFAMQRKDSAKRGILSINWRIIAVAAAAVALIAAVVWIYSGPQDSGSLYASYYEPYDSDLDIQFREAGGSSIPADTPLTRGLKAYGSHDFARAIPELQGFVTRFPDHAVARFYLGLSLVSEERLEEAAQQLGIVQQARQEYWEEACWYEALVLIKLERKEEARELLNTLTSPGNGRYYEKAKALINKL